MLFPVAEVLMGEAITVLEGLKQDMLCTTDNLINDTDCSTGQKIFLDPSHDRFSTASLTDF
jgi:hypothetical protein